MAHYQVQNVSFAYAGQSQNVLHEVSFNISRGDFALFCGPTGSGKTTLLRLLKKEVQPEGKKNGHILYEGRLIEEAEQQKSVEEIAMVFQDPDDQIVMETVWQELVFAMENIGYDTDVIQRRLAEVVNYFGMESWLPVPVHKLSGGQKQLLNLASVMMLRPRVLLLDEPTAQLDPVAAKNFLQTVHRINQELSTTVIISEHRLEEVFPLANLVLMLEEGKVKHLGQPREVLQDVWNHKDSIFLEYLPSVSRLYLSANGDTKKTAAIPMTVREAKIWADNKELKPGEATSSPEECLQKKEGQEIVSCRNIYFQYDKEEPMVLKGLSLKVNKGDFYTLLGGNGSGKTTLLKILTGINNPQRGSVLLKGKKISRINQKERTARVGYLAQNPALYFNRDTVEAQLKDRMEKLGLGRTSHQLERNIAFFNLENILKRHPYDLSGGQQQKVALALVLLSNPDLILLDEPTKGLDPLWKLQFAEMLTELIKQGSTILMVSHDIEFAARFTKKCALFFGGQVIAPDSPRNFFSQNYFYTTVIQRALGEKLPQAIGIEDVSL